MVTQSITQTPPALLQTRSSSTKETSSSNSVQSYQPDLVNSSRRLFLRSLQCERKPDQFQNMPTILPVSGRYLHGVKVSIRLPRFNRLLPTDQCIIWTFSMSPMYNSNSNKHAPGPTVRGRIPARAVCPFEDGYELTDRSCGYKARGSFSPVTLELALPGEYVVTVGFMTASGSHPPVVERTLSRTYFVTPLSP